MVRTQVITFPMRTKSYYGGITNKGFQSNFKCIHETKSSQLSQHYLQSYAWILKDEKEIILKKICV